MSIKEAILIESDKVQARKSRRDRKDKGVFYTPPEVIERMTEKALSDVSLIDDPYIRILDPACGTGLFLVKAFQVLKDKFEMDFEAILHRNVELQGKLEREGIGSFIVENNLWGEDIDREALAAAGASLVKLAGKECGVNLLCRDSLLESAEGEYDRILGNPPYIGHKTVTVEHKKILQQLYKGIYKDKSDISYCFFKKGIDSLKQGGTLSFITSRYFMEGPSAAGLRKYITDNCTVTEIVDFHGRSVFQDAGVAACIITVRKESPGSETEVLKHKPLKDAKGVPLFTPSNFEHFAVDRSVLKAEGWVLLNPDKYGIYTALEAKGQVPLGEIADSCQGIITGCDKAFIVDSSQVTEEGIEEVLLKPWIKNSDVLKYNIKAREKFIIYADSIKDEKDFPNAIKHIGRFREKLEQRRECRRGVRKWYQLQWGRDSEVFDSPKIVYPYKSSSSRFAVDNGGNYCSADIYSLKLKKQFQGFISLDYLTAVLNSTLFEFYFKCYAKKISENLYDYYPNTVLRMRIPMPDAGSRIKALAHELRQCKKEDAIKAVTYEIDRELYKLYGLNQKQIEIVEGS